MGRIQFFPHFAKVDPRRGAIIQMRIATQKEALPNDIESLIRRIGQELSCSICLSVFEDPTMTPCNHTFCRECIERAVTLTKKGSSIPCNQCPICKSKTPKRSLNPSAAAAKLCKIYEEIVRCYSEINGGSEDWIHESGIRGNDAQYATFGGVPLDNLSQLYPYPEKPKLKQSDPETAVESDDLLTELEEEMDGTSRIYDETTQLETNENSQRNCSLPSSPLIFAETQLTCCDRLIINTQELEKLSAINDSIDKELAELEKKLKATRKENEQGIKDDSATLDKVEFCSPDKATGMRVIKSSESKSRSKDEKPARRKMKTGESKEKIAPTPVTSDERMTEIRGITTTGIKDEKLQIQLANFSDKFNFPISPDFQGLEEVSHLLIPTGGDLIVKKRTMKYFEGILLDKEIVSFDWIASCLKAGKLLPSTSFKIKGDEVGIKQNSRIKYSHEIFSNCKFYLYGEFSQPPRDQLERLIHFTSSPLLSSVHELSRGSVILADPSAQFTFEKDAQIIKKYPIIGTAWFLDSISCGKALEFHGYYIL